MCVHGYVYVWQSENSFLGLVFYLNVGSGNPTEVRLHGQFLHYSVMSPALHWGPAMKCEHEDKGPLEHAFIISVWGGRSEK